MAKARILVVDDEIIIARELESRLRSMGYEVTGIAASGAEALRLTMETSPDLVLMDIVLKGDMDGIETAAEIRQRYRFPIIYVTAYTDEVTIARAKITEPFGYIVKPFSERELHANIEMALYKDQMDKRFRRVEQWFSDALADVADAIVATDTQFNITVFNPAAEAITSWRRAEAIGKPLESVLRMIYRESGDAVDFTESLESPIIVLSSETCLIDKVGTAIPVDSSTTCTRDERGYPTGTVTVFRDVSGQRQGAISITRSDIALAAGHSASAESMLWQCAEALVRNLNLALAQVWTPNARGDSLLLAARAGIPSALELQPRIISMGSRDIGQVAASRVPQTSGAYHLEAEATHAEWGRAEGICGFAAYPLLLDGKLLGVLALYSHRSLPATHLAGIELIASELAAGMERKHLEEQLRQSRKMESIGQLAGGIAHDFNNLLTVICGYTSLLLDGTMSDEDREVAREVHRAGERAAGLTRKLLAFSRKQVLEPVVLDLNKQVQEMGAFLQRVIGEDIILSTTLEPDLRPILADPGQIEQVIANLAVNARDAMPRGGQLTIETRNLDMDENFLLSHPGLKPGNYVLMAVSDTGSGMPPEIRDRVFEPFFTTKAPGQGTGLGLSTVYGVCKQSGGHIEVYSEPGIGTSFKVYLPCAASDSAPACARADLQQLPRGTETILLVEDDEAVRGFASRVLANYGYRLLDARNAPEALAVSRAHPGPIDLLVTDVVMPGMNGRALAECIATERAETRVVFMSGYTEDAIIRHGVLQAERAFLPKPFSPRTLLAKVREVLDKPASFEDATHR